MVRAELLEHLEFFFFFPKVSMEYLLDRFWDFPKLSSLHLAWIMLLEVGSTWYIVCAIILRDKGSFYFGRPVLDWLPAGPVLCLLLFLLSQCLSLSQSFYILSSQALQLSRISFLETLENLFLTWSLIIPHCKSSGQFSVQLLLT